MKLDFLGTKILNINVVQKKNLKKILACATLVLYPASNSRHTNPRINYTDDMIKRFCTLGMTALLAASSVFAAPEEGNNGNAQIIISEDSITVKADGDSAGKALVSYIDNSVSSEIVEVDDKEYLLHDGKAFKLTSFDEMLSGGDTEGLVTFQDESAWNANIVPLMAIIFIVPCLTILILAFLLIHFLNNKNQSRNELISKAIDNNYPLPDSFFGIQPGTCEMQPDGSPNNMDAGTRMVNPAHRDPKKFSSAITLIAVGVGLFMFLLIVGTGAVSCFGLIPLLLGIGQLLGYYYVPGFTTENLASPRRYGNYGYDPYNARGGYRPGNMSGQNPQNCPPPPPSNRSRDYNR